MNIVKYLWQLPQHTLALLICTACCVRLISEYEDVRVYRVPYKFGLSLGQYIFVHYSASRTTWAHEYGHSLQSRMLGPLYLLIVGLPSITMNILTRLGILSADNYYKRWPENWADTLGKVDRDTGNPQV